jgi:hypothetical protein
MTVHPAFQGMTLAGDNTKENVAFYLTSGRLMLNDRGLLYGSHLITAALPESTTQPLITPHQIILHSNAAPKYTPWQNLVNYMKRAEVTTECHFQVDHTGVGIQVMPVIRRADCNYKANSFVKNGTVMGAVSFETSDNGYPTLDKTEWNLEQCEFIIGASFLLCVAYSIGCAAPAYWNSTGIGHHSLHKEWSNVIGKTCPGAARIRQMDFIRNETAQRIAAFYQQCGGTCP